MSRIVESGLNDGPRFAGFESFYRSYFRDEERNIPQVLEGYGVQESRLGSLEWSFL